MITTVPPAVSTSVVSGLTQSLALTVLLSLVYMLIHKEVAHAQIDRRWQRFNQALNIIIIPLTINFFIIAFAEIARYTA